MPELLAINAVFGHFGDLDMSHIYLLSTKLGICHMTACLSFHQHHVLQNVTCVFRLLFFIIFYLSFFSFSYLFAAVIELPLGLLPVEKFR